MGEQPPVPETPDEDLPQDPGIPDGAPAPDEDEDSLERPSSPPIHRGSTRQDRRTSRLRSTSSLGEGVGGQRL